VGSHGQTVDFYLSERRDREAAKIFLRLALIPTIVRPSCSPEMACGVIRRRYMNFRLKVSFALGAGSALAGTAIIRSIRSPACQPSPARDAGTAN
jgi:hypothetical protein